MESNQFVPFARVAGRDVPPSGPEAGGPAGDSGQTPVIPLPDYGAGGPAGDLGQTPVVPLPDYGEGGPAGDLGQTPVVPLPDYGEGGPVGDLGQIPVVPLPDYGEGGPVSDAGQIPMIPLPEHGMGGPAANPGPPKAYIRFLNAVLDEGAPLRITLGNRLMATYLAPGNLTAYAAVPAGFRTLFLYDARFPRIILYRSSLPLAADEVVTLAVVRSGGGIDLVRVDDRPCGGAAGRSCLRMVNLGYNSPGLDLVLTDGRVVFTDVRFKEVTAYRRAKPGRYDLYVAQTPYILPESDVDIETVEEMPVMISNYFLPGYGIVEPLAAFYLDARAGTRSTIYLMGNWNISPHMQVRIVENA